MKKDEHRNENAKRILKRAGYSEKNFKKGGSVHTDEKQDKKLIKKMVKKDAMKKKDGGYVDGVFPKKRLDKVARQTDDSKYARGGKTKVKKGTTVNIVVGAGQKQPVPVPVPAGGGAPPMPPRPAPAPMPPGGAAPMPPAGGAPRPPMKKGGAVKMEFGSGGGKGRLEKAKKYGPKPRNKGGKC